MRTNPFVKKNKFRQPEKLNKWYNPQPFLTSLVRITGNIMDADSCSFYIKNQRIKE